jgi:hypothetical protein
VSFALDVDDVHRPGISSEAHDVVLGPVLVLARDGIVSGAAFVPVDAEHTHVQVDHHWRSLSGERRGARRGCASTVERQASSCAVGGPSTSGRRAGAGSGDLCPLDGLGSADDRAEPGIGDVPFRRCARDSWRWTVHLVAEARPDRATGREAMWSVPQQVGIRSAAAVLE